MTAPGNAPASTAPAMIAATPSKLRRSRAGERHRLTPPPTRAPRASRRRRRARPARRRAAPGSRRRSPPPSVRPARRARRGRRVGEHVADDVDRGHAVERAARLHGAEDHAGRAIELAGLPKLGEEAIEAIGPLVNVLEEHDRPVEIRRVGRPEQSSPARRACRRASRPVARPGTDRDRHLALPRGTPGSPRTRSRCASDRAVSPRARSTATIGPCTATTPARASAIRSAVASL